MVETIEIIFRFALFIGAIIIPYLIGNYLLNEYLPNEYREDWAIENKILKIALSWIIGLVVAMVIIVVGAVCYAIMKWIVTGQF